MKRITWGTRRCQRVGPHCRGAVRLTVIDQVIPVESAVPRRRDRCGPSEPSDPPLVGTSPRAVPVAVPGQQVALRDRRRDVVGDLGETQPGWFLPGWTVVWLGRSREPCVPCPFAGGSAGLRTGASNGGDRRPMHGISCDPPASVNTRWPHRPGLTVRRELPGDGCAVAGSVVLPAARTSCRSGQQRKRQLAHGRARFCILG